MNSFFLSATETSACLCCNACIFSGVGASIHLSCAGIGGAQSVAVHFARSAGADGERQFGAEETFASTAPTHDSTVAKRARFVARPDSLCACTRRH